MNSPADFETRASNTQATPLHEVLTTSLAQEAHDIVRHLGTVLDVQPDDRVLLVPGNNVLAALTLVADYGCRVTVLMNPGDEPVVQPADDRISLEWGALDAMPFEAESFDAVIVAVPVTIGLQRIAAELSRVLKHNGRLGLVALSLYRDQVDEHDSDLVQPSRDTGQIRPAAAYRVMLAEAGFTAFLTEDRRRRLRRSAQEIYREHMLEPTASATETLGLFATGGISTTLITAEKGV